MQWAPGKHQCLSHQRGREVLLGKEEGVFSHHQRSREVSRWKGVWHGVSGYGIGRQDGAGSTHMER